MQKRFIKCINIKGESHMKKILGSLFTLSAILFLTACSSEPTTPGSHSTDSAVSEADNSNLLEKIKESGELVMGTSPDFAPFEFPAQVDGKNEIIGADVDIAKAVAEDLGVELKIMQLDFNNLMPSMQAGKLNMVLAGVSATKERQKNADFSIPYYTPSQKIVVKKDKLAEYTTVESFTGKNIGAQQGSIQEDVAKEQLSNAKLTSIPKNTTMLIQVASGGLDGMVLEGAIAESYVKQNPDLGIADVALSSEDDEAYAVALPKNSGALKEEVDKIIQQLIDEGKIDEFIATNSQIAEENAQ